MGALSLCSERPQINGNVLSVGLWARDDGQSEAQLEAELVAAGSLTSGRSASLLFTLAAIQSMASAAWSRTPKNIDLRIGFLRLGPSIVLSLRAGKVITRINGQYKVRFAPNVSFAVTISDLLSLHRLGSPALEATTSTKVDPNLAKFASFVSLISPTLGALTFWQGDELIPVPDQQGVGGALAIQWPEQILTEISPPDLPGKLTFLWADLVVDEEGVRTLGAVIPMPRSPTVVIQGPSAITVELPVHMRDGRTDCSCKTYGVILRSVGASTVPPLVAGLSRRSSSAGPALPPVRRRDG